jgi:hypothetical protein
MRKAVVYSSLFRAVLLCFRVDIFVGFRAAVLIARPFPSVGFYRYIRYCDVGRQSSNGSVKNGARWAAQFLLSAASFRGDGG